MRIVIVTAILLLLAGCAPKPPLQLYNFERDMYVEYADSGPCAMTGQAFARQRRGTVVYAAGETVILTPPSDYFFRMISGDYEIRNTDYLYRQATRRTTADANGEFSFSGVPCGRWIAMSQVYWMAGRYRTGGRLYAIVDLEPGEVRRFILK